MQIWYTTCHSWYFLNVSQHFTTSSIIPKPLAANVGTPNFSQPRCFGGEFSWRVGWLLLSSAHPVAGPHRQFTTVLQCPDVHQLIVFQSMQALHLGVFFPKKCCAGSVLGWWHARKPTNPPTLCLAMGSSGGSPENIGEKKIVTLTYPMGYLPWVYQVDRSAFGSEKVTETLELSSEYFSEFPRLDLKVTQPFGTMKQKFNLYQ